MTWIAIITPLIAGQDSPKDIKSPKAYNSYQECMAESSAVMASVMLDPKSEGIVAYAVHCEKALGA